MSDKPLFDENNLIDAEEIRDLGDESWDGVDLLEVNVVKKAVRELKEKVRFMMRSTEYIGKKKQCEEFLFWIDEVFGEVD